MQVISTPAILTPSSQYQVRLSRLGRFSMAAEAVMSLKIEPGVKEAEMQRLMKVPSRSSALPSTGSVEGTETMPSSSPVR